MEFSSTPADAISSHFFAFGDSAVRFLIVSFWKGFREQVIILFVPVFILIFCSGDPDFVQHLLIWK